MESLVQSEVSRGLVQTDHNIRRQDVSQDQETGPVELGHFLLADIDV